MASMSDGVKREVRKSRSRSRSRSPVRVYSSGRMHLDPSTIASLTCTPRAPTCEHDDPFETLSSIKDSDECRSSLLSDDLGEIVFSDDELDDPSGHDDSVGYESMHQAVTHVGEKGNDDERKTYREEEGDVSHQNQRGVHVEQAPELCNRNDQVETPRGRRALSSAISHSPSTRTEERLEVNSGATFGVLSARGKNPKARLLSLHEPEVCVDGSKVGASRRFPPASPGLFRRGILDNARFMNRTGEDQHVQDTSTAPTTSMPAETARKQRHGSNTAPRGAPTVTCKVLVVGNAKCGKSSIISRFVNDEFSAQYLSTVGADYAMKDVELQDGRWIRLQLWDIAGQDRFAKLTRAYFRRAKGAIVVCDVTREGTFDAIVKWKEEIDQWCVNEGCDLPVFLFANKCDLLTEVHDSFLAGAKMERTCRDAGFTGWYITSAKRGDNIHEAMTELLHEIVEAEARRLMREEESEQTGDALSGKIEGQAFQLSSGGAPKAKGLGRETCCA